MKVIKIACILFIVASITWGCSESGEKQSSGIKQGAKKQQVQKPAQKAQSPQLQTTQSGEPDKFGRKPGEQHYGHDHASDAPHTPPTNTQQATPAGEPDKFGRKPGDQHYGHDHE